MFKDIKKKVFSIVYSEKARVVFKRLKTVLYPIIFLKGHFLNLKWKTQYRFFKGDILEVSVGRYKVKFHTPSFEEFALGKRLYGERRTIKKFLVGVGKEDTVYDIGANIGVYTCFLAKAVGEDGFVIAFEPEERSRQRLEQNVDLNGLKNVRVIDKALGSEDSKKDFLVCESSISGGHSFFEGAIGGEVTSVPGVEIVQGDEFIKNQSLPLPNIIKIDVEGMEYDVLRGLSEALKSSECKAVICEVHFAVFRKMGATDTLEKIKQLLKESGFINLEWLDKSHLLASK